MICIHVGELLQWRGQEFLLGVAKKCGAEIETPKAWRGMGIGRGVPLPSPSRLKGLGSVVSSPSGVRGGALAENGFCAF